MFTADKEVESLRALVGARFPVYQVNVRGDAVAFYVTVNPATLDADFEALRLEVIPKAYIPFLTKEQGEHILYVQRRPPRQFWSSRVNAVLLVITVLTTMYAGALNWAGYEGRVSLDGDAVLKGTLFFALPLLLILGLHETGHYIVARRYRVSASLPFFIPSIPPLGTFGAMISMRDPIPTRRALMDIGASGPLLGLAVAIPVTVAGLLLTGADPRSLGPNVGGRLGFEPPFLFSFLSLFFPIPPGTAYHPTLFAGWVGIFVTAMNLLPAGQLDGGHVARALLGDRARYASYAAVLLMFFLSFAYPGWAIIALFIVLLGLRHPPPLNDLVPLDGRRLAVGLVTSIVLVASFVPVPISEIPINPDLEFRGIGPAGNTTDTVALTAPRGAFTNATFAVANTGNVELNVTLTLVNVETLRSYNWSVDLTAAYWGSNTSHPQALLANGTTFSFNSSEHVLVHLSLFVPSDAPLNGTYGFSLHARVQAVIGSTRYDIPGSDLDVPDLLVRVSVV